MNSNTSEQMFLASWDCLGLEYLVNLTNVQKAQVIATLKGEKVKSSIPLGALKMRAMANPQRHYEIYAFNSLLTEEEIRHLFDTDPQAIVDAIRPIGRCLYNNRDTAKKVIC